MKMEWNDVKDYFKDLCITGDKTEMQWYQSVWSLLEKQGATTAESPLGKLGVFGKIYGTAYVFTNFYNMLCDDCCEVDEDFGYGDVARLSQDFTENEDEQRSIKSFLHHLIHDEQNARYIFSLLKNELGKTKTFASLYYVLVPDEYPCPDGDTQAILDDIMNTVDSSKMRAFEWLGENM